MENTSNYGLKRWDGGALTLHTEFNDNWDKIDTAIKGSEDKAAAALAATTALEQKMGLQHIQTVNGTTGDCSIFTYSIDWDQWTEVLFFLTPKLSGSNLTYQLSFENRAMTSDGSVYFSGTLGGRQFLCGIPIFQQEHIAKGLILRREHLFRSSYLSEAGGSPGLVPQRFRHHGQCGDHFDDLRQKIRKNPPAPYVPPSQG